MWELTRTWTADELKNIAVMEQEELQRHRSHNESPEPGEDVLTPAKTPSWKFGIAFSLIPLTIILILAVIYYGNV